MEIYGESADAMGAEKRGLGLQLRGHDCIDRDEIDSRCGEVEIRTTRLQRYMALRQPSNRNIGAWLVYDRHRDQQHDLR